MNNCWIQYKIAHDERGVPAEIRNSLRLPYGGLTWLLSEEWGGSLPKRGDRFRVYKIDDSQGDRQMWGADGDWVVTSVTAYEGPPGAEYDAIVVCDCLYAPLPDRKWTDVPMGQPYALV